MLLVLEYAFMEPQVLNVEAQNEFAAKLETMVKDFTAKINHCQEQSNLWQEKKKLLQNKMTEVLQQVQKQCGFESQKLIKKTDKEATVPQLIRIFLEHNGPARPREIRKFLLNQGRTTNPGVALGRLVAEGVLKNTERGVYKLS